MYVITFKKTKDDFLLMKEDTFVAMNCSSGASIPLFETFLHLATRTNSNITATYSRLTLYIP